MVKVDLDHVYKMYKGNDKYSVSDFNLHIDDQELSSLSAHQVVVNRQL